MNGRRSSHFIVGATAWCLLLMASAKAEAQTPESTDRLAAAATTRTTVYVVERSGEIIKGRLTGLTDDILVLELRDRLRRVSLADVVRVEKRDSIRNGALIGGVTALALWFIPMYAEGERCTATCVPMGAYAFSFGAGLGALIDVAIPGRTALYPGTTGTPVRREASGALGRPAFALAWRF